MQHYSRLQRRLHLPDIQWNFRRVRERPGTIQTSGQTDRMKPALSSVVFEKGAIMSKKIVKSTFLAAIVTAVLCAGTVSARQLKTDSKGFAACKGKCSSVQPCSTGCICAFPLESTTGFCSSHPTGLQAPTK
jgi:hypothetical protein